MTIKKFIVISGGMTALFVAVMAFLHTPQGLKLWGRMRGSSACPLGMDVAANPQARDAHRATQALALRGEGHAKSNTFLGFELGQSQRKDVDAWAQSRNATCHETRSITFDLECSMKPDAALAIVGENGAADDGAHAAAQASTVFFVFDSRATLRGVHAMTHYADADSAAQAFSQMRRQADSQLGPPPKQTGEPSATFLAAGLLRQVAAEYHLQDVYARLSATHMSSAYIVEEQYRAIAD